MNPTNHLKAPKGQYPEGLRTFKKHHRYKEGAGFGEWWDQDCGHNLYSKINYDFLNNYLYLYLYPADYTIRNHLFPAIRQILLSVHPY